MLLILSGVAISTISGNNGVLNKVVNAKIKTEEAAEKEKIKLALMAARNENGIDETEFKKQLENEFGENNVILINYRDGTFAIYITQTNRKYDIDENLNLTVDESEPNTDNTEGFAGSGTELDPYLIQSIEDLVLLSTNVNNGQKYANQYFKLERDLDFKGLNSYRDAFAVIDNESNTTLIEGLNTGYGFTPIGNDVNYFGGKFNGGGNSINNLYINSSNDYVGLFGYCKNNLASYAKNDINIKDVFDLNLTGKIKSGETTKYTGSVVAYGNVKDNIISRVNIKSVNGITGGIARLCIKCY